MDIDIISFSFTEKELFKQAFRIRTVVFTEEQNVPPSLEYDGEDENCTHFLLFLNKNPIATARIRKVCEGIKLERFAVLKDFRNQQIGKILLNYICDFVSENNLLWLNSQEPAVDFYRRHGFTIIGESFYEAGIKHYKMVWL